MTPSATFILFNGSEQQIHNITEGSHMVGDDGLPRTVDEIDIGPSALLRVKPTGYPGFSIDSHGYLVLICTVPYLTTAKGTVVDVSVKDWDRWDKRRKASFRLKFRSLPGRPAVPADASFEVQTIEPGPCYRIVTTGNGRIVLASGIVVSTRLAG